MENHICHKEREFGMIGEFIKVMKENHLPHINSELEKINIKMSSPRPSWSLLWILSFLVTFTGILVTVLLMRK